MVTTSLLRSAYVFLLLALVSLAAIAQPQPTTNEATDLIGKMDSLLWSTRNQGRFAMTIETEYWRRELELDVWMHRPDNTFIRVLSPRKERGVGSLRLGSEMWNYIPNIDRVIKVPPSMMLQPWMGSDLSNDDLVKQSSIVTDYSHDLVESEGSGNGDIVKIVSTPNSDAAVVWGRIESWIHSENGIPERQLYFDDAGEEVRELNFSEVELMDGREIPTRWVLRPFDDENRLTIFEIVSIKFDHDIDPAIFTQRNLRSQDI